AIALASTLSGAYAAIGTLAAKLAEVLAQYLTSAPLVWPSQNEVLLGIAMFMFIVWTSCWFYAASALGWKRFTDDRAEAIAIKVTAERFDPEELRALREKRDRQRQGA
ncbi:MAG: hypothetical protein ACRC6I_05755, partial [Paracoccaceae bacterium]